MEAEELPPSPTPLIQDEFEPAGERVQLAVENCSQVMGGSCTSIPLCLLKVASSARNRSIWGESVVIREKVSSVTPPSFLCKLYAAFKSTTTRCTSPSVKMGTLPPSISSPSTMSVPTPEETWSGLRTSIS